MKANFIKRYVFWVGLVWSLACSAALISHLRDDYQQTIRETQTRARTMLERDILYRDWVAKHGGVYVPITDFSPPNPHLEFLPGRDIETTDGRQLTLINPSYMTHQTFAMDNSLGDTISKITSLRVLNPDNAPDPWEKEALQELEQGGELISGVVDIDGRSYVRVMRPFHIEEACLDCHAIHGYKVGDIRGGLSISIPFESFLSGHWQHNLISIGLFTLLWLVGVFGVALLGRKLHAQTCQAIESDRQRDHAEMSLDFLSNYDRRTNLPNRFKFEEQIAEAFQETDRSNGNVAVAALEIRNYKQIIDNFDTPVGDTLFKLLAERVAVLLAPGDAVARLGEDRLLFSCTSGDEQKLTEVLLPKFHEEVSKPLVLEGYEFFPVACMGVAFYPSDAIDAMRLVQKASSALTICIESKQSGLQLYSQSLQDEARKRFEIESGLRHALVENSLELFLQPQVDAISGDLIGAEALLRWQPDGGDYLSPAEFIPVAEESDLILPVGEWVLQTACIQAVKLREKFERIIPVGVNVSARQFQDPAFVDIIDEVLAIEGMSSEMLEIEITEGTFIEDIDRTIELLTDLKMRGLQIAIDDFGTGYSSLSYLNRFPVDRLKVDRSFITDIASNEDDRLLVGLIVDMGNKLGLNVIAEGVEDDVQKHLLIGMGCHAIQGFLFSRPLPFDAFCSYVEGQDSH